jgi:hypothetical protein
MKKFQFIPGQDFDICKLEVTSEDGPSFRLLEFKGFSSRQVDSIQVSTCNAPRKAEYTHGNVDVLEASLTDGWAVKLWPLSIFRNTNGEEVLFDGRHTLRAMKNLNIYSAPVAIYERIQTGNKVLDSMSDETALGLMGLYVNATDGTTNAVNSDFIRMISSACQVEEIPLTGKNVKLLMDISGVNQRYKHKNTITSIYNAVTRQTASSTKVFNTTKEEMREYVEKNPFFGINNVSPEDGVSVRMKVMDHQFNYRYAGDILRWYFQSDSGLRVALGSKATDETRIEADREEIIDFIEEIYVNSASHYVSRLREKFGSFINLPEPSLDDLSDLSLWGIAQIEGETESVELF